MAKMASLYAEGITDEDLETMSIEDIQAILQGESSAVKRD